MNTVRWTAALLCLLQTLAIAGTVMAVSADVRIIAFLLPLLSLLGLVISAYGFGFRYTSLVLFGLSPCVVSLYVVYLIHRGAWQPTDAGQRVTNVLLYYELLVAPIGMVAFLRVLCSVWPEDVSRARWRFRLLAIFGVTFAVALVLGVARFSIDLGFEIPVWLSLATITAALEAATLGGIWVYRRRQITERTRSCPAWVLTLCLAGYAVAPYISALFVREYPSPQTPWELVCRTATWHLPTLLLAVPIFFIVWLRNGRYQRSDASVVP